MNIQIKGCKDCPLADKDSYICLHPAAIQEFVIKDKLETKNPSAVPFWCPLKTEPTYLILKTNE